MLCKGLVVAAVQSHSVVLEVLKGPKKANAVVSSHLTNEQIIHDFFKSA